MKFSMRFLLILTAMAAISTQPAYEYSAKLYRQWQQRQTVAQAGTQTKTVVTVPKGGTVIMGGFRYPVPRNRDPLGETSEMIYEGWIEFLERAAQIVD